MVRYSDLYASAHRDGSGKREVRDIVQIGIIETRLPQLDVIEKVGALASMK